MAKEVGHPIRNFKRGEALVMRSAAFKALEDMALKRYNVWGKKISSERGHGNDD